MQLVLNTWNNFQPKYELRHETKLTAVFREALIQAYVQTGRNWFVTLEDPVTEPDFGTQQGRNDLRFFPPSHCGQSIYFTLECKRLRVRTKSGMKHLVDKYVDEGVKRFVDGRYSAGLPCGGMLGYVMDNNGSVAFASVQAELKKKRTTLKIPAKSGVHIPSTILPSHQWSADTIHRRSDGEFLVHHVLVGVKECKRPSNNPRMN